MSKSNLGVKEKHVSTNEDETSLKGTFIFVMFVGSFLVISWIAVFFLFIGRT
ncbi:cytochrome c oxidase subunit 2A [Evansella sp. AB-P1]|uniref:cytochrome c oxidase subunit 2A n=1 Tax=Evansella sp. AB-P1 TaxID=3037653 RepID=UPI00241C862E|nr:cytochrome c oxidase subunit 2A [Evansella sp. AB-P1]MDG5787950.1 cytochrome c oxidase subunit 2A [Evansella sp. AB-P1]